MKRIIDGKTYNTDTATRIASDRWEEGNVEGDLYLTRGGAFFTVERRLDVDEDDPRADWAFEPLTSDQAEKWVMAGRNVELHNDSIFAEPPEASEEREPEATIYVRVPRSLKERIEAEAKDDDLSLNAWVMRCVERCASQERAADALGRAHYIANSISITPDGYTEEQCRRALSLIEEEIVYAWHYLGLPREKGQDPREDVILHACEAAQRANITRDWEPYQDSSAA